MCLKLAHYERVFRAVVRITNYWIVRLIAGDVPLYDTGGRLIACISRSSYGALLVEGTGRLPDGRIVNYVDGRSWSVYYTGYGVGVGGRALVPWQSCAVDTAKIPLDSVVYWRGRALRAVDVGSGVRGWHVDIFTGDDNRPLSGYEEVTIATPA